MNERLQQFLAAENLTQAQFADSINVARAGVSHIISGRNRPGYDFLLSVMKRYPDLNIEWLISGKGKMYKRDQVSAREPQTPSAPSVVDDMPDFGGLFQESEREKTPRELNVAPAPPEAQPYIETTEAATPPSEPAQKVDNQRKVSKIILFYNDGTFQEF